MLLRDSNGHRRYDKLIQGTSGRTSNSAQNKLIKRYYDDNFKNVKYNAMSNKILKIIE